MTLNKSFFLLSAAFISLCTLGGALVFALSEESPGRTAWVIALVAFAVAAGVLWAQAQRDLDAVLALLGTFLVLTALCVTIYLFSADKPGVVPKVVAVVSAVAGIAAGVTTFRRQRSESADFPNILARQFKSASIFETEGVQFTGFLQPGGGGKPHRVSVVLQSCFDAPRAVTIQFDAASCSQYVRIQPRHGLTLGPAEVARVTFPVVTPTYPGQYPLFLSISVGGTTGRRVRLWRAQDATERIKTSTTVALLAVGVVAVGGGIQLTVGPLPDDLWNTELPNPIQESLWLPRFGTVPPALAP